MNKHQHWENIYQKKEMFEVSWFQAFPKMSIKIVKDLNLPLTTRIIDIGGGDSFFVDSLLELGFTDISVLDISETSINKAKKRLGDKALLVNWIVSDINNFKTNEKFDLWHDRAAFHFLTETPEIQHYKDLINKTIQPNGYFILATFSEDGPKKCSGIEIKQYSETSFINLFEDTFTKLKCFTNDHQTPFDTIQNFIYCCFKKL